jgi:hypothetical protein
VSDACSPTYYEQPVLKEPVWIWTVPAYFFTGGAAGAASLLGAVAQAAGDHRHLVRACRRLGLAGAALSAALLVADLGRPRRFLNMLRVFRPTSPMSVGSWTLAAYGPLAGGAAVLAGRTGAACGAGAGVLGPVLAGYTGVLLAGTAVPVWQAAGRTLPPLFAASAVAGAASLLDLVPLPPGDAAVVRRYGIAGRAAELAVGEALRREVGRDERVGRPLRTGVGGALWRVSASATAASLALSLPRRPPPWLRTVRGALGAVGSLALRTAVFTAGRASVRDPRATFEPQRRALSTRG